MVGQQPSLPVQTLPGGRCYRCFRPRRSCFCAAIPDVDNQTEVLILQHPRERFHPFNTARIAHRALRNSRLVAEHTDQLARTPLRLSSRAGLLYPGAGAKLLSELNEAERPDQLVIIDGTWHHAKTIVRDLPALAALPQYQLLPSAPGRYRIRREPNATSLSTIEATVAALRVLEPDTAGFEQLLASFDDMVERQLADASQRKGIPRRKNRTRIPLNIPSELIRTSHSLVVAYGEAASGGRGCQHLSHRPPIYWVAERLGTDARFRCAIQNPEPLAASFLRHLRLGPQDFDQALSIDAFRAAWQSFLTPQDTLVVYNQNTARQLSHIDAAFVPCIVLKSVNLKSNGHRGTLEEVLTSAQLVPPAPWHPGRPGQRLANAVALVQHLQALGRTWLG